MKCSNNCVTTILNFDRQIEKFVSNPKGLRFSSSLTVVSTKYKGATAPHSKIITLLQNKIHELQASNGIREIPQKQWETIRSHIGAFLACSRDSQEVVAPLLQDIETIITHFTAPPPPALAVGHNTAKSASGRIAVDLLRLQTTLRHVVYGQATEVIKVLFLEKFAQRGGKLKEDRTRPGAMVINWRTIDNLVPEELAISIRLITMVGRRPNLDDYTSALRALMGKNIVLPASLQRIADIWLLYYATIYTDTLMRSYETCGQLSKVVEERALINKTCGQYAAPLWKMVELFTKTSEQADALTMHSICDISRVKQHVIDTYSSVAKIYSEYSAQQQEICQQYEKSYTSCCDQSIRATLPSPAVFAARFLSCPSGDELVKYVSADIAQLPKQILEKENMHLDRYLAVILYGERGKLERYAHHWQHIAELFQAKKEALEQACQLVEEALKEPLPSSEESLETSLQQLTLSEEPEEQWTVVARKPKKRFAPTLEGFLAQVELAPRVRDWFLEHPQALQQEKYRKLSNPSRAKVHLFHSYPGAVTFYAVQYGLARTWDSNPHFTIIGEIEEYGKPDKPRYRGLFSDCISTAEGKYRVYHHCFTERSFDEIMEEYAEKRFLSLETFHNDHPEGIEESAKFDAACTQRFRIDRREYVIIIDDSLKKIRYTLALES